MTLATVGAEGQPSARIVLLKALDIARAHVPPRPEPDDGVGRSAEHPSEPVATNSDALMLLAETFLHPRPSTWAIASKWL